MCSDKTPHCGHQRRVCDCPESRMERFIEPCLMLLLLEKQSHGYELMSRLKEFGFGDEQDPGAVYRNLRRLEEQGWIRSEWDTSGVGPARRSYEVTEEGRDLLQAWAETIRGNIANLNAFLDRYEKLNRS